MFGDLLRNAQFRPRYKNPDFKNQMGFLENSV